jgi:hypothetical protein
MLYPSIDQLGRRKADERRKTIPSITKLLPMFHCRLIFSRMASETSTKHESNLRKIGITNDEY